MTKIKLSRLGHIFRFFVDLYVATPHPWELIGFCVGWAVVVAVLNDGDVLDAGIVLDSSVLFAIKTILSFLLVFRTNQSVQRWYEGRILWGRLTFACIELSQQSAAWIEDPKLSRRIMQQAIAFAYAVKEHLRGNKLEKGPLEGIIHPAEVDVMGAYTAYKPFYCVQVIRECIKLGLTTDKQPSGQQAIARGIDVNVAAMTSCFHDMSRIKSAPQPTAYRTLLFFFTIFYLLLLPVLDYETTGYYVIPEVFFTSYLMLGLQLAADYLEDPFGYDPNDLKVDEFWQSIRSQCLATFSLGSRGHYDLTLPDGGAEAMSHGQGPSSPGTLPVTIGEPKTSQS